MGARRLPDVPLFLGTTLEETQRRLQEFLDDLLQGQLGPPTSHGDTHKLTGTDPLPSPGTPLTVLVGASASPGDGPGFMAEDAQLVVSAGMPVGLGSALAAGSSSSASRADHVHKRDVEVLKNGVLVGIRRRLNFLGAGVTVVDNLGLDSIDITITGVSSPPLTGSGPLIGLMMFGRRSGFASAEGELLSAVMLSE